MCSLLYFMIQSELQLQTREDGGKRGMDGSQPAELMAAAVSGMDVERGNK